MTKTEAAEAIALQVVVAARKAMEHQTAQGKRRDEIHLDGNLIVWEILSEAAGGHMGGYLQQAAETANVRTVRIHVKRIIKGT